MGRSGLEQFPAYAPPLSLVRDQFQPVFDVHQLTQGEFLGRLQTQPLLLRPPCRAVVHRVQRGPLRGHVRDHTGGDSGAFVKADKHAD